MKAIVAVNKKSDGKMGIGINNDLPWRNKEDLKWFQSETMGKTVVMGRKTFDSLPPSGLKGRKMVVLSKTLKKGDGYEVYRDKESLMEAVKEDSVFIIGGSSIYSLFEEEIEDFFVTYIDGDYECDTFLNINLNEKFPYSYQVLFLRLNIVVHTKNQIKLDFFPRM